MTLDELAVMRWVGLSDKERAASSMGPPIDPLCRIAIRLRGKQKVDKRVEAKKDIIFALAARVGTW